MSKWVRLREEENQKSPGVKNIIVIEIHNFCKVSRPVLFEFMASFCLIVARKILQDRCFSMKERAFYFSKINYFHWWSEKNLHYKQQYKTLKTIIDSNHSTRYQYLTIKQSLKKSTCSWPQHISSVNLLQQLSRNTIGQSLQALRVRTSVFSCQLISSSVLDQFETFHQVFFSRVE